MADGALLWAPAAWLDGCWQPSVLLQADTSGHWSQVTSNVEPPEHAQRLPAPVLPPLVNAHSHAFQRAFVGLAERRDSASDDFWSWRDRMYGVALRITPAQLRAIAAQLYLELLRGGYTQTCEFHYLHHHEDGSPYADPLAMSWALADAAADTGMGLTVLPVLYAHAGFAQPQLRDDQRRFKTDADWVWRASQAINAAARPRVQAGVALHSLRAAHAADIGALRALVGEADLPIHIHISEQPQEVADCLAAHGQRPMQWLANQHPLDARWQLVHATHSTPDEIAQVAASGAGVVICPGTEANLGDGVADLPGWLVAGVPLTIGSDSHATRAVMEELRWLDYGQRLVLGRRNVAADPPGQPSTAARLFDAMLAGSARAAGLSSWGLQPGARADALVLDPAADGLLGVPTDHLLDAAVFSADPRPYAAVLVGGEVVLEQGRHARQAAIATAFEQAMRALFG